VIFLGVKFASTWSQQCYVQT